LFVVFRRRESDYCVVVDFVVDFAFVGGLMLGSETVTHLRDEGCTALIVMCSGNCTDEDKHK
jgi:hypothetical protein